MTELLARNWPWIVFVVVFVAMHRAGFGCGMHGSHGHGRHDSDDDEAPRDGHEPVPSDSQERRPS